MLKLNGFSLNFYFDTLSSTTMCIPFARAKLASCTILTVVKKVLGFFSAVTRSITADCKVLVIHTLDTVYFRDELPWLENFGFYVSYNLHFSVYIVTLDAAKALQHASSSLKIKSSCFGIFCDLSNLIGST